MLPIRNRISKNMIGAAGVHHVCSLLSMRDLIAMPTIRNTADIDILVTDPATSASANLQVKTSQYKVTSWPTSRPDTRLQGPNFFYVFLRYITREKTFQVFIEDSEQVVRDVTRNIREQERRGLRVFPYWALPRDPNAQRQLENNWFTWRPPH